MSARKHARACFLVLIAYTREASAQLPVQPSRAIPGPQRVGRAGSTDPTHSFSVLSPGGSETPILNIMRQINLKSAVRTIVLAIVMLVAGTALAPQAQASKFRGIVGGHFGCRSGNPPQCRLGGGASATFGLQLAKQLFIGAGINYSSYGGGLGSYFREYTEELKDYDILSVFVNPRLDFFNVSNSWTPFISGRIGCQMTVVTKPYWGFDFGIRRSIGTSSKGISLGVGIESATSLFKITETIDYGINVPYNHSETFHNTVLLARVSFEF